MEQNKVIAIVAAVCFVIMVNIVGFKIEERVLEKRVTQNVMEQLRRSYAPGPYNPGFDPDKVDPRVRDFR